MNTYLARMQLSIPNKSECTLLQIWNNLSYELSAVLNFLLTNMCEQYLLTSLNHQENALNSSQYHFTSDVKRGSVQLSKCNHIIIIAASTSHINIWFIKIKAIQYILHGIRSYLAVRTGVESKRKKQANKIFSASCESCQTVFNNLSN